MEVVSAIVGPVVNLLMVHITQKLRNFTSSADRVKKMIKKMEVLDNQRVDNENRMKANSGNNKEIPARVLGWLKEVEDTKKEVEKIPSNHIGCFNVKKKYLAGRNALRLTEDIEGLIKESSDIIWSDAQIPLGRVDSKRPASTSTSGGNTQNMFDSRVKTFNDALKLLQQNDAARVIALCGMGGVGKTTLMNQLKEAATDKKMFNWIPVVVIGKTPNLLKIQKAVSAHTGESLTETDERLMATYLSKRFREFSERKEKSLVILDDVWEKIKLEDIGLAGPLPNGVKLLITSRDVKVCRQIAVDADSALEVVEVDVLKENEAQDFFCQKAEISAEHDCDLYEIGCEIVKKCGCLPLAIKLTAATLKCEKNRSVWRRTLRCLKNNDLDKNLQEIIEISYNNLKREEDKSIFLLCGLFPEDSNITIEDLTRYAWGLKLLNKVYTMEDARDSAQTSVSNLKNAYLLMDGDSDYYECVKMHDLVLAFVVNTVSKGGEDGCWIIHHEDDFSNWSEANSMSQSCKQLSLTCKGMSEFPSEFQFPNLSLLKLMHGNESLRFPLDFYEGMKKLQVIAFDILEYPVVPTSFQCSTNLRTLCLHECSLMFDLNCVGNLLNLEVLSFANSGITILPSTFENLKKLRLLDVTGCYNLVIDEGVLKSLVKLEELYMRSRDKKACWFTDNNCSELAERSKNLCALEFEFFGNNAHMKNMSYEKLKRFKLSVGCYFSEVRDELGRNNVDAHSYQNSLKLITNKEELLKSKISELFMNTDALYLQVNDMNTVEDVDVESPHPTHPRRYSSFGILRLLVVSECTELKYLFTPSVAKNLSKLEYLDISGCPIMEGVIHTENDGSGAIKFSNLKYLRLAKLPKLLHFCNNFDVVELPRLMELQLGDLPKITCIYPDSATSFVSSNISPTQSFLNARDATPKLEKLVLVDMENMKEIWPPQFSRSNLFPLRMLKVKGCDSIEVLFNMDFGEIEQLSSSLRSIKVKRCDSLVKLFSCNPFPFLNNLQELSVESCGSIQVLFNTDLGRAGKSEEQVCSSSLRSIVVEECDSLVKLFSCNPFPFLNNLEELNVKSCGSIQVLFNTDLGRAGKSEEQVCSSSLRSIVVEECDSLVNLFTSNPTPLFNHLEELTVTECGSIEVIFDINMGCVSEMDKVSSSRLRSVELIRLGKLREVWRIKDAENNLIHGFEAVESIWIQDCERFENLITPATTNIDMRALKEVEIYNCGERERSNELVECNQDQEINVIPTSREELTDDIWKVALPFNLLPTFHHIHKLVLDENKGVEVVFEIMTPSSRESPHNTQQPPILPYLEELRLWDMGRMSHVWKCDWNEFLILQKPQSQSSFHNLTTIKMFSCNNIKYLFSPLMAKLLSNLKKIDIWYCDAIEEVVSNRDDEDASIYSHTTTTFFPRLDLLYFNYLKKFKCIGGSTNGISTDIHDQLKKSQASWSLCQYAREISIKRCDALSSVIPCYAVGQMQKLQVLKIEDCDAIEEVVSNRDDEDASINSHTTTTFFPRLDLLELKRLRNFKCIGGGAEGISTDIHDHLKKSQASWSLCQYTREISIKRCDALSSVIPWYAVGQMQKLQVLKIEDCESMREVFESQDINNKSGVDTGKSLLRLEYITMLKLPKLKILKIQGCNLLKHIFTFSTLESLKQLEELEVKDCKAMEVIVTKENGEQTTSDVVVFDHLKSLILDNLPNFVGFFLGKNEFIWPTLEKVVIRECQHMTVFTYGRSTTPKLNFINTSLGKHSVECGLDFRVTTTSHQAQLPSYESASSYRPTTMERLPWSYHNLIKVNMYKYKTSGDQTLFSSDKLLQLQKLETVRLISCRDIEQIFNSQTVAEIPNLRQVDLEGLYNLKYIWKSKLGTVLKLPNLTRLSINSCDSLEYVFTCPMVGSLLQLQELNISWCSRMKVIVKGEEEECDAIVNATVVFPCLKSLKLDFLSLKGFWLGKEAFEFPSLDTMQIRSCRKMTVFTKGDLSAPSLDTLEIRSCPKMTVFTKGDLSAPKLYAISCSWDRNKYNIHNRLNSVIKRFTKG